MASLPEQIIGEVFDGLSSDVATAIGRRETSVHARAPRVVAVPIGAPEIRAPDIHGRQSFIDSDGPYKTRALLVREFAIEWHCHGAPLKGENDFSVAEALYLDVITLLRNATHNAVRFSGERWIDQEDQRDGFVRWGTLIVFESQIQIPIMDGPRSQQGLTFLTGQPPILTDCHTIGDGDHA
jgi:hypothetical protein